MNAKELRQKSGVELQKELLDLRREQFNLRMARATGQAAKPDQFTKVRRNIARLKTVLAEQRRGGVPAAPAIAAQAEVQTEAKAAKAKAPAKKTAAKRKTTTKAKSA
jgi:large subunit ribosomal protein L29